MTTAALDGDGLQGFLRDIVRKNISDFMVAVATDDSLIAELGAIDIVAEPVAAFAREKGFSFSADELTEFVEDRISKEVPADERIFRDRERALRGAGGGNLAVPMDAETNASLHDVACGAGIVLDRDAVMRGDVLALRQLPSLPGLLHLLEEILTHALGIDDLEAAHEHFEFQQMKDKTDAAYGRLAKDSRIVPAVLAIIDDLGLRRDRVLWEWPGFRLLFPVEAGGRGVYRAANSAALAAHRDTWYGSPQHQINLWGPIKRLDPDATLRILTRYFCKTVSNSSYGYDNWQNYAGIALPPNIRARVNPEGGFAPSLDVGDALCFSGHQLHASAVNRSGRTRVSFEFRLLHLDDEGAAGLPPNVDSHGLGEIYKGWYNADGRHVNRLTGKVGPP